MHAPAALCCPAMPSMGRVTSRRWRVDLILGSAPGNKTMAASRPNSACTTGTAMALGPHERGHELGHSAPGVLLRQVRRTQGSVPVRVEYEPRPEFGLIHPRLVASADAVTAHGGSGVLVLSTQAALTVEGAGASALVTLHKGQESCFAPRRCDAWAPVPRPWTARRIRRACRSCSASAASGTCRNGCCRTCLAGAATARCGPATTRGSNGNSTCTARCWTRPIPCAVSSPTCPRRCGSSWSPRSTRRRDTGATRIRESGNCVDRPGRSCTASCHLGLTNAAYELAEARRRRDRRNLVV
jgi:hypothetical protein